MDSLLPDRIISRRADRSIFEVQLVPIGANPFTYGRKIAETDRRLKNAVATYEVVSPHGEIFVSCTAIDRWQQLTDKYKTPHAASQGGTERVPENTLTPNSALPPTAKRDPLDTACEQVGRFLFYFAQVEIGIDAALAKLLELKEGPAEIVTANIDFNRKLNILQSVVEAQSAGKPATWKPEADTLISNIRSINSPPRQIVAHSPFEPGPEENSVRFKRVVARDKLRHEEPVWTEQTFKDRFTQMQKYTLQLKRLADDLKPYAGTYFFLGF